VSHYSLLGMNLFQTAFLNNPGLLSHFQREKLSDMVNILRAAWVDRGEGGSANATFRLFYDFALAAASRK